MTAERDHTKRRRSAPEFRRRHGETIPLALTALVWGAASTEAVANRLRVSVRQAMTLLHGAQVLGWVHRRGGLWYATPAGRVRVEVAANLLELRLEVARG
jgi:hypothetical protein